MHTATDRGGPCGPSVTLRAMSSVRFLNRCRKYPSPGGKERQLDQHEGPNPLNASHIQQSPMDTVLPQECLTIGGPRYIMSFWKCRKENSSFNIDIDIEVVVEPLNTASGRAAK